MGNNEHRDESGQSDYASLSLSIIASNNVSLTVPIIRSNSVKCEFFFFVNTVSTIKCIIIKCDDDDEKMLLILILHTFKF